MEVNSQYRFCDNDEEDSEHNLKDYNVLHLHFLLLYYVIAEKKNIFPTSIFNPKKAIQYIDGKST